MKKYLKELASILGGFSAIITLTDWKIKQEEAVNKRLDLERQLTQQKLDEIIKKGEENIDKLIKKTKNFSSELKSFLKDREILKNESSTSEVYKALEKADESKFNKFIDFQKELDKLVKYCNDKIKESDKIDKFSPSDILEQLNQYIIWYKKYLSTLNLEQVYALLHILLAGLIFILIYNLAIIYYSDLIINYLKIENKYPKFAKFVELRRKFQRYYFTFNLLLIIIVLITILWVNVTVLMS